MKHIRIFISSLVLSLASLLSAAEGSFISLVTDVSISVTGDHAQVSVSITNKGDEEAYNLKTSLDTGSSVIPGRLKDKLLPGGQYREEFDFELGFEKSGRHPVIINTEYTDANLYPFNALSVSYLNYRDSSNAKVTGALNEAKLAKTGGVSLSIKNIDEVNRRFRYRLVAPKEMSVANPIGDVTVSPGETMTIPFRIKNLSALQGSNYPLFALVSYEDEKNHCATIIKGSISVSKESSMLDTYKIPLLAIVVILILIIAVFNLRDRTRRGAKT